MGHYFWSGLENCDWEKLIVPALVMGLGQKFYDWFVVLVGSPTFPKNPNLFTFG